MHVVKMIAVKNGAYVGIFQRRVGGKRHIYRKLRNRTKNVTAKFIRAIHVAK